MTLEQIEKIISEHQYFRGLEPSHIESIVEAARRVNYNAGEFLMREDEPGNCFFIILHGKVAVEVFSPERGSIIVSTMGENEVLGYCWLIPPYQCRYDVRAVELTRTICVDGQKLRYLCEEHHDMGFILMQRTSALMAKLLEATRLQMLDFYGNHS